MYHVLLENPFFLQGCFFLIVGFQVLISQQSVGCDYPFLSRQAASHPQSHLTLWDVLNALSIVLDYGMGKRTS